MKKILFTAVISIFMMLMTTSVFAESIELTIDDNKLYKIGKEVEVKELDVPAFETEGRTLVPVRAVAESFGAEVSWDETAQTVGIVLGDIDITLTLDSEKAYVNGNEYILDVPAFTKNDRTMVPIRFVSEALKYQVGYTDELRLVYITNEQPVITVNDVAFNIDDVKAFLQMFSVTNANGDIIDVTIENLQQFVIFSEEAEKLGIDVNQDIQYIAFMQEAINEADKLHQTMSLTSYAKLMKYYSSAIIYTMSMYGTVTEDAVASAYNNDYICAKHILFQAINEEDKKEVRKLAEDVLNQLRSGADFDTLMVKYGQDPGVAYNPNGYVFTKGEMVKPFEDAAYALKPGEMSELILTDYGYHIIKREKLPELTDDMKNAIGSNIYNNNLLGVYNELKVNYNVNVLNTKEELLEMISQ